MDYRRLNALTIKNSYPMPIMEEFLDELAGQYGLHPLISGLDIIRYWLNQLTHLRLHFKLTMATMSTKSCHMESLVDQPHFSM